MRGFVREILTIGSLLGAAAATYVFGPNLTPMTRSWIVDPAASEPQRLFGVIPYEMLAPVIAFALVFVVVLVALTLATHLISKGVHSVGLGPVDRSLGVAFGLVRGVIILGLMGLVMNFVLSDAQKEQYFSDSKTFPMVTYTADLMQALMPDRSVLEHGAKKNVNKALAAAGAATGHEPLEPGQKNTARKANDAGYTAVQRKTVESLMEPQIEKVKKKFND
jgi:membrane protein required for colicin V production